MGWIFLCILFFMLLPRSRKTRKSKPIKSKKPKPHSKGLHRRKGVLYNSYRVGDTNYCYNHKTHKLTKRRMKK